MTESAEKLAEYRVLFRSCGIKQLNQFYVRKTFDLTGADECSVAAGSPDFLSQPLEGFITRWFNRQDVSRSLSLNGTGLFEFAPNGDALGLVGGRESKKEEKPGKFLLYVH